MSGKQHHLIRKFNIAANCLELLTLPNNWGRVGRFMQDAGIAKEIWVDMIFQ